MHHLDRLDRTLFRDYQSDQRPHIQFTGKFQAKVRTVIELNPLMDISHSDSCALGVMTVETENGGQFLLIHSYPVVTHLDDHGPGFSLEHLDVDMAHLLQVLDSMVDGVLYDRLNDELDGR